MNIKEKILELTTRVPIKLTPSQGWLEGFYKLSSEHIGAIQAAYLAERPLLVRGGPGLGKSQLAQAIASCLDWGLISCVVHYNTTVEELLYSIDHVKRLDDANTSGTPAKDISKYLQPGKVWQAIAPDSLEEFEKQKPHNKAGTVLLIDEIDKADATLPNALLEVLANSAISVPYLKQAIQADKNHPFLVVITSNDERQLPKPFIRRCAVLDIQLPEDKEQALAWMMDIFKVHYPDIKQQKKLKEIASTIAKEVMQQRQVVKEKNNGDYLPGTSEFLDMIKALYEIPAEHQQDKLKLLSKHLIEKKQLRDTGA